MNLMRCCFTVEPEDPESRATNVFRNQLMSTGQMQAAQAAAAASSKAADAASTIPKPDPSNVKVVQAESRVSALLPVVVNRLCSIYFYPHT